MDKKTIVLFLVALAALAVGGWALFKQYGASDNSNKINNLQNELANIKAGLPPTWGGWPSNGYMIKIKNGPTIYFSSDTDLMLNWQAIHDYYAPDIVIATNSVLYQMGVNEWVYALNIIKPKYVLASHHGSFPFYPKTDDDFVRIINEKTSAQAVKLPPPGDPLELMGTKITWMDTPAF